MSLVSRKIYKVFLLFFYIGVLPGNLPQQTGTLLPGQIGFTADRAFEPSAARLLVKTAHLLVKLHEY
ncbi:hypothetical protein A3860_36365 [Niastella vici]|uniref:Uncharacterized protein n=1 Tax=Niastella vici TaxID=1703345 RepID=A0A1V9FNC9_9BACT|nr:hypothetical protein A3860_36365 [Niastella vici]